MKAHILKALLILETLFITAIMVCFFITLKSNKITELSREVSPDGEYLLIIEELGMPDWPFGNDHLRISLYGTEENSYSASFMADVANNGTQAGYDVRWEPDGVQIVLSGIEQPTAYYIMPFKTLVD